jgi:hypothetical protein
MKKKESMLLPEHRGETEENALVVLVPAQKETITISSAFEQMLKTLQELHEQIADTIV